MEEFYTFWDSVSLRKNNAVILALRLMCWDTYQYYWISLDEKSASLWYEIASKGRFPRDHRVYKCTRNLWDVLRYTVRKALGDSSEISLISLIQNYPRYGLTTHQSIENYFSMNSQAVEALMSPNSDYYRVILSEGGVHKNTLFLASSIHFLKLKKGVLRIQEFYP